MLRTVLAMFIVAVGVAWGQAQSEAAGAPNKLDNADTAKASTDTASIDKGSAYYHYALAHMYTRMAAATGGRNNDYVNQAIEHYKAAIKADPETAMLREELSDVESGRLWLYRFQYRRRPSAK
jgi:hypothetical protein